MAYIIAPFRRTKTQFNEFLDAMRALQDQTGVRAQAIWPGFSEGGMFPQANQYGYGELLPKQMNTGANRGVAGSNSFLQRFSAPGSWVNIFSYTVPNDQIHSFAGVAFPEPYLAFNALQFKLVDRSYPIMWLEEARAQVDDGKGIAIVLKPDKGQELVVPEKVSVTLAAYQERGTGGFVHRVIPLGLTAYRQRDTYTTQPTN